MVGGQGTISVGRSCRRCPGMSPTRGALTELNCEVLLRSLRARRPLPRYGSRDRPGRQPRHHRALGCKHVAMPDHDWQTPKGRRGGTPTVTGCLLVLLFLCAACTSGSTVSSPPASPREPGTAGLRAAARAWSDAFLTGTVADIRNMEGASCLSGTPTYNSTLLEGYLRGMRAEMEHYVGVPLGSIRITGVRVRNVTAITGEAEVEYALPPSMVGNDNWVTYQYRDGQWKETNCHAPIGGESQSTATSTSRP